MTKEKTDAAGQLLLEVAAHFRAHPEAWTQHVGARDVAGNYVGYNNPSAVSRCIDGELCHRVTSFVDGVYWEAARRLKKYCGTSFSIWNDAPGRTAEQVADACEKAAQL
jgi:hypothetical protein